MGLKEVLDTKNIQKDTKTDIKKEEVAKKQLPDLSLDFFREEVESFISHSKWEFHQTIRPRFNIGLQGNHADFSFEYRIPTKDGEEITRSKDRISIKRWEYEYEGLSFFFFCEDPSVVVCHGYYPPGNDNVQPSWLETHTNGYRLYFEDLENLTEEDKKNFTDCLKRVVDNPVGFRKTSYEHKAIGIENLNDYNDILRKRREPLYNLAVEKAGDYLKKLKAFELLEELKNDILMEHFPDMEVINPNFEDYWQEELEYKKDGKLSSYIGITYGFDFTDQRFGLTVCFPFNAEGAETLNVSEACVSVGLLSNYSQEKDKRNLFPRVGRRGCARPPSMYLPRAEDLNEELVLEFKRKFIEAFNNPIKMDIRAKFERYRRIPYNELGIDDFREILKIREQLKGKDFSNPFEGSVSTLGVISHRLGRVIDQRYGLESLIEEAKSQDKQVVFSSERFGDHFAFVVRWDIGEFKDYAGKEVIVIVRNREEDLQRLREGKTNKLFSEIIMVGRKQSRTQVIVPISKQPTAKFLLDIVNTEKKLQGQLREALNEPRKATRISEGSISSSMAYVRPILEKDIPKKKDDETEVESGDDYDYDRERRDTEEDELIHQQEIDAADEWEQMNPSVSIAEAHGEVTWMDGRGTDEDGCEVYTND
jgi:hypothetical protein